MHLCCVLRFFCMSVNSKSKSRTNCEDFGGTSAYSSSNSWGILQSWPDLWSFVRFLRNRNHFHPLKKVLQLRLKIHNKSPLLLLYESVSVAEIGDAQGWIRVQAMGRTLFCRCKNLELDLLNLDWINLFLNEPRICVHQLLLCIQIRYVLSFFLLLLFSTILCSHEKHFA